MLAVTLLSTIITKLEDAVDATAHTTLSNIEKKLKELRAK